MSIRTKILIPMVILIVLVSAAILTSNIFLFSNYVDSATYEQINTASNVATYELETRKVQAQVSSLKIAEDPSVIFSIATGNREALVARAIELQNDFSVEFLTIMDPTGTVIVRSHEPENFGDSLASQANIRSAMSGTPLTLIEKGSAVLLSIRSGAPIYSGDQLIGIVSSGFRLDIPDFVDTIKTLLDCEVTVFLGDMRISTTVLKDDGTRATGTTADPTISAQVLGGTPYEGQAQILGHDAITKYTPLYASGNEVIGMMFVGQYLEEETKTISSFLRTGLTITAALLIISVIVIFLISRRIVMPINHMVQAAHSIADGDTNLSLQIQTKDEMRELSNAFNVIIENTQKQVHIIETIANGDLSISISERSDKDVMNQALKTMLHLNNTVFSQIIDSATHVSSAARQMADSSQSLAQGATEQAATVHHLSNSIMDVSSKTEMNADMADKAASLAREIKGIAQKGSGQMVNMVQAVKEINDASQQIGQIIKVIDDIAFQTNILALNAAVEAARAGQHGKGFAVVAEEVRNLAAKSAEAAKNTGSLIENSMVKAELGVRIADETEKSLAEIISGINKSSEIVEEIARSSTQQTEVISQVTSSINQVTEVVQQNSAVAQESAAISAEMNGQASLLQDLVGRFTLKR